MDLFMGSIMSFGFSFAPRYWALCAGQVLPISQNTALFALLGTYYGGNGQSNFQLPNLQSRVPMGQGQGQGLTLRNMGESQGQENTTLTIAQLPPHTHTAVTTGLSATTTIQLANPSTSPSIAPSTTNAFIGASSGAATAANIFSKDASTTPVIQQGVTTTVTGNVTVEPTGGGAAFSLMNPFLVVNFSIVLQGIFPTRN